jgi:hypothetical protein
MEKKLDKACYDVKLINSSLISPVWSLFQAFEYFPQSCR